jgi:hypothetical protein
LIADNYFMIKKTAFISLIAISTLFLSACSNSPGDYTQVETPTQVSSPSSPTPDESEDIDMGEGTESVTLDLPDFSTAGEEGESSAEAWLEFATVSDNSKNKLLAEGGYEYFGMYNEPYYMLYDSEFLGGKYWTVYYLEKTGSVQIGYDIFEMAAYNSGIELYVYGSVQKFPETGTSVAKNPDGSYSVKNQDSEFTLRYAVEDGLIKGRAVWDESSNTFLGYTSVGYGLSADDQKAVDKAFELAAAAGETFLVDKSDDFLEAFTNGSAAEVG